MKFRTILITALLSLGLMRAKGEVIIQYFETDWDEIYRRIPELGEIGYDGIWLPPPVKSPQAYVSSNAVNIGYALYDRFDLGDIPQRGSLRTQYGTRGSLRNLVDNLHYSDIKVYPDIVINHNSLFTTMPGMQINDFHVWQDGTQPGGWRLAPRMTDYDSINNGCGYTFQEDLAGLFDIVTEPDLRFQQGHSTPCGSCLSCFSPEPAPYIRHPGQFDKYPWYSGDPSTYTNENVREMLMRWLDWLGFAMDYDGCRVDAAKHVVCDFYGTTNEFHKFNHTLQWNFKYRRGYQTTNEMADLYANDIRRTDALIFCETATGSTGMLDYWRNGGNKMRFLDFPLKNNYIGGFNPGDGEPSTAAFNGDLSKLPTDLPSASPAGLTPTEGVTFSQSHDNLAPAKSELALAYILTHAGVPIVYFTGNNIDPNNLDCAKVNPPGKTWLYAGNRAALGDFNGRITNLVYINNQFARGKEQNWWRDSDFYALERFDDLNGNGVNDPGETLLLVALNDSGSAQTRANSASYSGFPSGTVLHDYSGNASDVTVPASGNLSITVPVVTNNQGWVCYAPYTASGPASGEPIRFSPASTMTWIVPGGVYATNITRQIPRITTDSVNIDVYYTSPPGGSVTNVMIKWGQGLNLGVAPCTAKSVVSNGFAQTTRIGSTNNWRLVANVTGVPEGLHTIQARCFNSRPAGYAAIYQTFYKTIYVDRHGPDLSIQTLANGGTVNGEAVAIIKNPDKTATNIMVSTDGGVSYKPATEIMKGLWKCSLSGLSYGSHSLIVHAEEYDWGNPRQKINESTATSSFFCDTSGPAIALNYAEGQTNYLPFFRTYITVATNIDASKVTLYWDGYQLTGLTGTGTVKHVFDGSYTSGGVSNRLSGAFCNGPHFFEAVVANNNQTNKCTRLVYFNLYGQNLTDSDGDGLPDDVELPGFAGGTQPPSTNNATFPGDIGNGAVNSLGWGDGIPNYGETWTRTNPWREDTWCNGIWDGDKAWNNDGFSSLCKVRQGFLLYHDPFHYNVYSANHPPTCSNTIYVAGTFNGWNPAANPMHLVSDYVWQLDTNFTSQSGVQFKFAANGTWDANWGDNDQIQFTPPMASTAESFAVTNIVVNGTLNGGYRFTFNEQTWAYSLQSLSVDSVGDDIPDAWRAQYFPDQPPGNSNGTMTNSQSCATCDPDGDGMSNLQEYLAGTVPTNSASAFRVTAVTREGTGSNDIRVTWATAGGRTNQVQAAAGAAGSSYTNNFTNLGPQIIIPGSGDVITNYVDDGGGTSEPARYYRVRRVP
jgi:hypothetical protein